MSPAFVIAQVTHMQNKKKLKNKIKKTENQGLIAIGCRAHFEKFEIFTFNYLHILILCKILTLYVHESRREWVKINNNNEKLSQCLI